MTPDDWDRANGWKIPSLVWTSLDAGLRPVEVKRSDVSWLDLDNSALRIPKGDSAKNRENWVVGLRDRTAEMLSRWYRNAVPILRTTTQKQSGSLGSGPCTMSHRSDTFCVGSVRLPGSVQNTAR